MESKKLNNDVSVELPLDIHVSFKKVYDLIAQYASDAYEKHVYHTASKRIKREVENYPFLIQGFTDFSLIEKHELLIDLLLEPVFPALLQQNEIKAASIPFSFESFKFTQRFKDIIKNAGDDYELSIRNFNTDIIYIQACAFILNFHYGYKVDLKRPFFFDIPDIISGITKHYRVNFNADFSEIIKKPSAPDITENDYKELLDNFNNIHIWKEKFPPESYIFKGFGIINLFDVTTDESIAGIRAELLKSDDDLAERIQVKMREFFNIKDLKIGFSSYDISTNNLETAKIKLNESLIMDDHKEIICDNFFCEYISKTLFESNAPIAISDVNAYGIATNFNGLYKKLKTKGFQSILIVPIVTKAKKKMVLLEIVSKKPYELNSLNQHKLIDLIPSFKTAIERSAIEHENLIEAFIQQQYTSIHPTVKWRFIEAAENFESKLNESKEDVTIEEIVFNEVYPLYGQADIKESSLARNNAIIYDLNTQLSLAISVLKEASISEEMPIYNELMYRVQEYLTQISEDLNAGDEVTILDFLKRDIYPVFNHIKTINSHLNSLVETYINRLDENLQVVYEKRKAYEDSVTLLNNRLSSFIDKKQIEAQKMFPHFFERFKTDGVEYNMYIGQSLVKDLKFDSIYLYNLRLWQLQLMIEIENIALKVSQEMPHPLRVASLILIHSNALAIKFRMDEKLFDVDGAYNIRYEIIKKRIDKSLIKGTTERVTVPGKISIVYSQDKDAIEYLKYINFLQAKNQLGKIEFLELEDLQGVSGLKALRVEVMYNQKYNEQKTITFQELIQEFK